MFIFFGCATPEDNTPKYKEGDSVFIVKNIKRSLVPVLREAIKEALEEQFKGLPIVTKFKYYESESCISFGFKFKGTETSDKFIQTNFTKDASVCQTQDYFGNEMFRGESGLVIFMGIK